MRSRTLLILEDDKSQLHEYLNYARMTGYDVFGFTSVAESEDFLRKKPVDVVLTDIHLEGGNRVDTFEGMGFLKYLKENHPEVLAIAMSSDPKVETFRQAIDVGASHFIKKPIVSAHDIGIAIDIAKDKKLLEKMSSPMKKSSNKLLKEFANKCEDGVVLPLSIRNTVKSIASTFISTARKVKVVIYGETGTGKEVVARLIHKKRQEETRAKVPFVAVNCSHLNEEIALSRLFGHKKGAFTGASEATIGYIGEADGGILFLDEIHTLKIECQQKLLRVLNDGVYERVGDTKPLRSDFQIVVASTVDLDDAVDNGTFLMDLRGRLTGVDISLKPLRERFDDLPYLIALYFAEQNIVVPPNEILKLATRCANYYWRGNIRQLFNALQTLVLVSDMNGDPIKAEYLPEFKTMFPPGSDSNKGLNQVSLKTILDPFNKDTKLETAVDFYEKTLLEAAIARHQTIVAAAEALGLSRSGIDLKRRKYGMIE